MSEPVAGDPIRRVLTTGELLDLYAAIDHATTTGALVTAVITGLYTVLLENTGRSIDQPGDPIDPTSFAIPAAQWQALADAATNRAQAWGTAAQVGLELVNLMPSSYEDPDLPSAVAQRHRPPP
jgi:hypothetical protein